MAEQLSTLPRIWRDLEAVWPFQLLRFVSDDVKWTSGGALALFGHSASNPTEVTYQCISFLGTSTTLAWPQLTSRLTAALQDILGTACFTHTAEPNVWEWNAQNFTQRITNTQQWSRKSSNRRVFSLGRGLAVRTGCQRSEKYNRNHRRPFFFGFRCAFVSWKSPKSPGKTMLSQPKYGTKSWFQSLFPLTAVILLPGSLISLVSNNFNLKPELSLDLFPLLWEMHKT